MENNLKNNKKIQLELIPKTIKLNTRKTSSTTQTQFPISQPKINIPAKPKIHKYKPIKNSINRKSFIKRLNSAKGKAYFHYIKQINCSNIKKSKLSLNQICYNLLPVKYERVNTEVPKLENLFSPKKNINFPKSLLKTEFQKKPLKLKKNLLKYNKYSLGGEDFNFCNLSKIRDYKNIISSANKAIMENDKESYPLLERKINNCNGIRLMSLRLVNEKINKDANFLNIA